MEMKGKRYCVLHYPSKDKIEDFNKALQRKLDARHFDFKGIFFPDGISLGQFEFTEPADFRSAIFVERAIFDSNQFSRDANFNSTRFLKHASFSLSQFNGSASFTETRFDGGADFHSAYFGTEVSFTSAKFAEDADFRKAEFTKGVSFSESQFTKNVVFVSAKFNGDAYFTATHFTGIGTFNSSEFSGQAVFKEVVFSKHIGFSSAQFIGATDFSSVQFKTDAEFNSALFGEVADLSYTTFSGKADFSSALYSGSANFYSAQFSKDTSFALVQFNEEAEFSSTQFCEKVDFSLTRFSRDAIFNLAQFNKEAIFRGTEFSGGAYFGSAAFSSQADFREAEFGAYVSFLEAIFDDYVRFSGSKEKQAFKESSQLDLRHARIDKPARVSFHTVNLRPHWFINVDASKFVFANIRWFPKGDNKKNRLKQSRFSRNVLWVRKFKDEIKLLEAKEEPSPHRLLAIAYRQLAINAEENHRYEEASRFRYCSMEAERLENNRGFAFWQIRWWYWLASGYGERVFKAFVVLLAIWFIFALFYTSVGFVNDSLDFPRSLLYSMNVMLFQKPEPKPATFWAGALIILQMILGPLQAALLALAVRRKFMR
jgi:hypothetical protein